LPLEGVGHALTSSYSQDSERIEAFRFRPPREILPYSVAYRRQFFPSNPVRGGFRDAAGRPATDDHFGEDRVPFSLRPTEMR
jgi:hypothetical protein